MAIDRKGCFKLMHYVPLPITGWFGLISRGLSKLTTNFLGGVDCETASL